MKLEQLTALPDLPELQQEVAALEARFRELFGGPTNQLQESQMRDVIEDLKQQLLATEDTTYQGIDQIMRHLSDTHDVDVHDLHDAFVDAEGVTPDEWIQSQLP